MHTATLYTNNSNNNVAVKNLTTIKTVNIEFKGEVAVENPTIILQSDSVDVSKCNYIYIEDFNRYYYATITVSAQKIIATCNVDVLSSYWNELKNTDAIIQRQENTYNLYLQDSDFNTYQFDNIAFKTFPETPFTKELEYVLATM